MKTFKEYLIESSMYDRKPKFEINDIAVGGTVIFKVGSSFKQSKVDSTGPGFKIKLKDGTLITTSDVWSTDASDWPHYNSKNS